MKDKAKQKNKKQRTSPGGLLLNAENAASAAVSSRLQTGSLSKLFCLSDKLEEKWQDSLFLRFFRFLTSLDPTPRDFQRQLSKDAEDSPLLGFLARLRHSFLHTRTRFFGLAGLICALYAIGGHLLFFLFGMDYGSNTVTDLCATGILFILSLVLLCGRMPLNRLCTENRFLSRLLLKLWNLNPASLKEDPEEKVTTHGGLAFVLGTVMGLCAVVFGLLPVLASLGLFLFCCILLCVPEAGLLTAAVLLLCAPLRVTATVTAATAISYFWKVLRMKRTFRLKAGDAFFALCIMAFGFAAMTSGDTEVFRAALLFGLLWLLVSNLLQSRAMFRKFLSCLLYGGIVTLFFPALSGLLAIFSVELPFALPDPGLSPTLLRCILLTLLPVSLSGFKRIAGVTSFLLIGVNAYLLADPWLYLGFLLCFLGYFAVSRRAPVGSFAIGVFTVPMLVTLFEKPFGKLAPAFSASPKALLPLCWANGVGAGESAIASAAFAKGILYDGASSGIWTRLLLEGGLPLLLTFCCAAVFCLQSVCCLLRETSEKKVRKLCAGLLLAGICFLVSAAFTDLFADLRSLGLFFSLCAAMPAMRKLYAEPDSDPYSGS